MRWKDAVKVQNQLAKLHRERGAEVIDLWWTQGGGVEVLFFGWLNNKPRDICMSFMVDMSRKNLQSKVIGTQTDPLFYIIRNLA